jgi:mono/diheme cytochrome c family protein
MGKIAGALLALVGIFMLVCTVEAQSRKPPSAVMLRGKAIFEKECLSCHQADGAGIARMNPTLIGTKWVLGPKEQLIRVVMYGLKEPIVVNDDEYYNPMPAHTYMTDEQISDVLTYVRNSFGNRASAVSAAEVKKVRAKGKK